MEWQLIRIPNLQLICRQGVPYEVLISVGLKDRPTAAQTVNHTHLWIAPPKSNGLNFYLLHSYFIIFYDIFFFFLDFFFGTCSHGL